MLNPVIVTKLLRRLQILRFFPSDDDSIKGLLSLVNSLATDDDQVEWLVSRMLSGLYNEWPGPIELRAVFCTRFKPKDGYSIAGSLKYPGDEGIPGQLCGPEPKLPALPPGRKASADPNLEASICALAEVKDINRVTRPRRVPSIPVENQITQADIDRAVAENRERRARRDLGLKEPHDVEETR
jgi:hypothetical protein